MTRTAPIESAVLNVKDFAAYVGISTTSAWRLLNDYKIPHERPTPKTVRISRTDADAFRAARRVTCAADARRLADGRRRS